MNATEAMSALKMSQQGVLRLRKSNLIPWEIAGRETLLCREAIENLAVRRGASATHGRTLLVKLGLPEVDPLEPTRMKGWDDTWPEAVKREAARKYWEVRSPASLEGAALIATVLGFVVGIWRIVGYESARGGVVFDIASPTEPMIADWRDRRLPAERGALHQTLEGETYSTS